MSNIKASCNEEGILTLTIDLNVEGVKSGSGKSMVKATTRGNKTIRELCDKTPESFANIKVGINIYKKIE